MREVGRRWHPLWDINVAARTKDWFAARAVFHLAEVCEPIAVVCNRGTRMCRSLVSWIC